MPVRRGWRGRRRAVRFPAEPVWRAGRGPCHADLFASQIGRAGAGPGRRGGQSPRLAGREQARAEAVPDR
ncbi:MAG TPA: hypothetical protein ENN09_01515 [Planctomycetes bacterium]|nr:hypothetical protein [Planctomycetota bacterium]